MEDEIGKTNIVIKKKPIHKDENNQYLQIINYQSREVNQTIFHVPQAPFPPPLYWGAMKKKKSPNQGPKSPIVASRKRRKNTCNEQEKKNSYAI